MISASNRILGRDEQFERDIETAALKVLLFKGALGDMSYYELMRQLCDDFCDEWGIYGSRPRSHVLTRIEATYLDMCPPVVDTSDQLGT